MKAFILKPFERRPGTTVRMGLPETTFTIGDDTLVIEYVKDNWPAWLVAPLCVELYDENRELVWESAPRA